MENRSHALTTGFFTITLLIAAILYGLWFNRDRVERVPYVIATAQAIPGLNPQAPVRYRGLEVGRVGGIAFDPKVAGQILVTLNINTDPPEIRGRLRCRNSGLSIRRCSVDCVRRFGW